ncbi:MFS transporter [Geodermatophilus sabuli]|uniref:MFS transporter, NNP family, nitrate/nitrite transporter n=1 Tax=Geodermatophilus sabuli TaxID=1564158 RepID=A0A285E5P6_9ACTN|nr:MFS transporter [Geodermatophilus sabuli]MBB3082706.1 NNP family nitrate/nitrite transporter-like MFS transporter [Geodermatophilus sabuli]SNX94428.1 MFS transporter, NNP family, nitrate/nitrite transporter [Geodermatophilus sabuli]
MSSPRVPVGTAPAPVAVSRRAWVVLAVATVGFTVNFWAWALISPLGAFFSDELGLSALQTSLLVAVPVVVGSLGRIPVGALTDRFGARLMFPLVSALTIVPVLFVGFLAADSYALLLIGGFVLGLGGTTFAIGVPLVNSWFPPAKRGMALGVFGAGMGGTAISAFTTVALKDAYGLGFPFALVAVLLAAYAVVSYLLLRDAPGRTPPTGSFVRRAWDTARLPVTLQLSFLYAVGFGGFVAFSVYLPTYLRTAFELSPGDAALRTAGFVVLAVVMRPVGGMLSDRLGPVPVLVACFAVVAVFAAISALERPLEWVGTVAFLAMAAALGASSGAVFALVAIAAPAGMVGSVTGIVGAAGGLGGFAPPLVMGFIYGWQGNYRPGLWLLAVTALIAAVYTARAMRSVGQGRPLS